MDKVKIKDGWYKVSSTEGVTDKRNGQTFASAVIKEEDLEFFE